MFEEYFAAVDADGDPVQAQALHVPQDATLVGREQNKVLEDQDQKDPYIGDKTER